MKKKILKFIALYLLALYLLIIGPPLGARFALAGKETKPGEAPAFVETAALIGKKAPPPTNKFRIYDVATAESTVVDERAFIFGALFCEMAPSVPTEALKAQVVALYTYYSYLREQNAAEKYDFAWDSSGPITYCARGDILESWGESAKDNTALFDGVIEAVYGQLLTYDQNIACTSYFPTSNGRTENAADLWGREFPYLISVASPYDLLSPGYETEYRFTPKEIQDIMTKTWPAARLDFALPYSDWFTELTYTKGGQVVSVNICSFSITGDDARSAFSLNSSTFSAKFEGDSFVFRSKGRGHGVGMSQTGASYMAADGAGYTEILNWYYPGTTLEKRN